MMHRATCARRKYFPLIQARHRKPQRRHRSAPMAPVMLDYRAIPRHDAGRTCRRPSPDDFRPRASGRPPAESIGRSRVAGAGFGHRRLRPAPMPPAPARPPPAPRARRGAYAIIARPLAISASAAAISQPHGRGWRAIDFAEQTGRRRHAICRRPWRLRRRCAGVIGGERTG